MSAICIIPARGGSRRIPLKNIREFAGKPMIAHAIETAQLSGIFDSVVVSSDDQRILDIAAVYGADIHHRAPHMAVDEVGTQEVMEYVLWDIEHDHEYACCLYPCTPLLRPRDLRLARSWLESNQLFYYVASVGYPPLRDAGAFYIGETIAFTSVQPLFDKRTGLWQLPPERICDINTEEDWQQALKLYAALEGE